MIKIHKILKIINIALMLIYSNVLLVSQEISYNLLPLSGKIPARYVYNEEQHKLILKCNNRIVIDNSDQQVWFIFESKKQDYFFIISGEEGSGTSLLIVNHSGAVKKIGIRAADYIANYNNQYLFFLGPEEIYDNDDRDGITIYFVSTGKTKRLFKNIAVDKDTCKINNSSIYFEGLDKLGNRVSRRYKFKN